MVVERVAHLMGLKREQVLSPGKYKQVVVPRSVVCYWCVRELGMSQSVLAQKFGITLTLQKLRVLQIQGVKGTAVAIYRKPLTTLEMRCHRLSRRVNNMAAFH